jgi:hypothetical protein
VRRDGGGGPVCPLLAELSLEPMPRGVSMTVVGRCTMHTSRSERSFMCVRVRECVSTHSMAVGNYPDDAWTALGPLARELIDLGHESRDLLLYSKARSDVSTECR